LRAGGAFAGEGARGPSKALEWCSLNGGIRSPPRRVGVLHLLHFQVESTIETIRNDLPYLFRRGIPNYSGVG